jgi:hypothetical protein
MTASSGTLEMIVLAMMATVLAAIIVVAFLALILVDLCGCGEVRAPIGNSVGRDQPWAFKGFSLTRIPVACRETDGIQGAT